MQEKINPDSLLWFMQNVYSQHGQDGILEEIFNPVEISSGYFVEFGAWDRKYLSNNRLLYKKEWSGVL